MPSVLTTEVWVIDRRLKEKKKIHQVLNRVAVALCFTVTDFQKMQIIYLKLKPLLFNKQT